MFWDDAKLATDAEHGDEGTPPELAEAKVGAAVAARVVADGDFADSEAGGVGDRRKERLHQIDGEQRGDDLPAHDAQLTTRVVKVVIEDEAADEVA